MPLVEGLWVEARDPVDGVLEHTRHRGVVLGRADEERIGRFQPPSQLVGAGREALLALNVGIVGGAVELRHRAEVDRSPVALDRAGGQLGKPRVQ